MRWNRLLITMAAATAAFALPGFAATFGTVVPITGHASDIALDEPRGLLYVANFTANRIEKISLADNSPRGSINVPNQPGGIALSLDGQFLVVTNYANWGNNTPPAGANLVTVIDLVSNARTTFSTGDPALSAAFVSYGAEKAGRALIATTSSFYLLHPSNGTLTLIDTYTNLGKSLPVPQATFPGQVTQAAMTAAADTTHVWGIADAGTGTQLIYLFDANTGRMTSQVWTTTPPLLPRVTVAADGSWAMIGWAMYTRAQCGGGFMVRSRHPEAIASPNVTGHAADSRNNVLYAQVADPSQPAGPPFPAGKLPYFAVLDADNLTVRDKILMAENMVGKAVLNRSASMMYAISDSGVMVMPVGTLGRARKLVVSKEDLLMQTNFCSRTSMRQTFTITDANNGSTDFSISASQPGLTISPASGTTPATITVTVDPAAIQNTFGTIATTLSIRSNGAVNMVPGVRLLISNPDVDQRGTVVNVPGVLTDVMADNARNRFYIVRQDTNEILVFDGGNNQLRTRLRTGTRPHRIALSADQKMLLVANADSQYVGVYDLDTLQPQTPVQLWPGHFARSVAQSNAGVFAVVENDAVPPGSVDRLDLVTRCAVQPPSLGIWENKLEAESVLTSTPGQSAILLVEPNGFIKLYDAQADAWVLSRKDFTALSGAYAATDPVDSAMDSGTFVVGNNVLNRALFPIGTLDGSVGTTYGFAFSPQDSLRVTGNTASGPGVIQNLRSAQVVSAALSRPVRVTEAPILSSKEVPFTRTVAPLPSAGNIIVLTTSGFTVLAGNYDAPVAWPRPIWRRRRCRSRPRWGSPAWWSTERWRRCCSSPAAR
jgi:DNA-binding beta-propeller fold protein YncE